MGRHDWYRNETWTPEVEATFRQRLDRSRGPFHKAQYLRIQAVHLANAGHHEAALQLLDELLIKYPERSQLASARMQRAECLLASGRIPDVVKEYRLSMEVERANPTVKTNAWLDFACLIVFHGLSDLYDEANAVLDEFSSSSSLIFLAQRFQYAAARAFLSDARADCQSASSFAKRALESAAAVHSGFRYHPQLCLVNGLDRQLEERLSRIAGG